MRQPLWHCHLAVAVAAVLSITVVSPPAEAWWWQRPVSPAADDDDELVPGLPEGTAGELPGDVKWGLEQALTAETRTRKRYDLAGWWRIAAKKDRDGKLLRREMGWAKVPGPGRLENIELFDSKRQRLGKTWRGAPASTYRWWTIERDLDVPFELAARNVFLDVRGPWSAADAFTVGIDIYVNPLSGVPRPGGRRFDLSEALIYGGMNRLVFRLGIPAEKAPQANGDGPPPYIGLELVPAGPRFEGIALSKGSEPGQLVAELELYRPLFLPLGGRRLRELPLDVEIEVRQSSNGATVHQSHHAIGPMPRQTRRLSLSLPWAGDMAESGEHRLYARLRALEGVLLDEAFPVALDPARLRPAVPSAATGDDGSP